MIKFKLILITLIIFALFSCKKETTSKKVSSNDSLLNVVDKKPIHNFKNEENKTIPVELVKNCDQTFEDFFERFSRDSIYQKSRVKYPLKWYYLEDNESNKLRFDVINKKDDYDYVDFTLDNQSDKYEVVHEKKEKEMNYILKGNDSGLFMTYKFKLIDGCWYMVEIEDKSV